MSSGAYVPPSLRKSNNNDENSNSYKPHSSSSQSYKPPSSSSSQNYKPSSKDNYEVYQKEEDNQINIIKPNVKVYNTEAEIKPVEVKKIENKSAWSNALKVNIDKPFENNIKEEKKDIKHIPYNPYYEHCWDENEQFSLHHSGDVLNVLIDYENFIQEYGLPIFDRVSNGNNKYLYDFLLNNTHEGKQIINKCEEFNNELKKDYYAEFEEEEEYNNSLNK